jgi:hypothetical protein
MDDGRHNGSGPADDDDEPVDPAAAAEAERAAAEAVPGTLATTLAELAAGDFAIEIVDRGGLIEYVVHSTPFARAEGTAASFRMRPEVVAAAMRTEDTAASALGRDWVEFRPRRWDRYALDRAVAWFGLARRLAGDGA